MIIEATNKILSGDELTFVEIREVFDEILAGLADDVQSAAFLTALKTQKNTLDIYCGAIQSSRELLKRYSLGQNEAIVSVSLADSSKYIDILLALDIICCANSLSVSRHSFNNLEINNSFKTLSLMGVDIKLFEDSSDIAFEQTNFAYFYLSSELPYCKYSEHLKNLLPFENAFNITSKMLNPASSKSLFLSVNKPDKVDEFAKLALKLNYDSSIVVSSDSGFPYASLQGVSTVAEAWKDKIFTYTLTPDLLGFNEVDLKEIECSSLEQNANDLFMIMKGQNKGAKYDVIVLNAALALYASHKAESIMDGIDLAKKTIDSSLMLEKFEQIKKCYS